MHRDEPELRKIVSETVDGLEDNPIYKLQTLIGEAELRGRTDELKMLEKVHFPHSEPDGLFCAIDRQIVHDRLAHLKKKATK